MLYPINIYRSYITTSNVSTVQSNPREGGREIERETRGRGKKKTLQAIDEK